MNSIYTSTSIYISMRKMAREIKTFLQKERLLINDQNMKGELRKAELEPGFYIVDWNVMVLDDYLFKKEKNHQEQHDYFLTYFFEPHFEYVSDQEGKQLRWNRYEPCVVFSSSKWGAECFYKKERSINCLTLAFSEAWLNEHLEAEKEDHLKDTFNDRLKSTHILKPSSVELLLYKQLERRLEEQDCLLNLKAYSYNLLNAFMKRIAVCLQPIRENRYADIMIEVERKLQTCLTTELPGINQLATDFYISASTLKRHFKQCFGVNIYTYYLENKMQLAHKMLQEDKLTVTEIATQLGYESVSHFIDLFKRHFGGSPGKIRQAGTGLSSLIFLLALA